MMKIRIDDARGYRFGKGKILSLFSFKWALEHALNDENVLKFPDSAYRIKARMEEQNLISIQVSGMTVEKVLNGMTEINASLTGRFRYFNLVNPKVNVQGNKVFFEVEDTRIDYRIAYDDYSTMCDEQGSLRLDYRQKNVWRYEETPHFLITGSTSSGKSQAISAYIRALYSQGVQFQFIDPKFAELSALGDELKIKVSHEWAEAVETLKMTTQRMKSRQKAMSRNKKLRPKPLFLVIEEAAALQILAPDAKAKKEYQRLLKEILVLGRSANCHVIAVMQAASAENVGGVELREQYGVKVILGSPTQEGLQFLMPAGVEPKTYGKFQGLIYFEGQGVRGIQTPTKYLDKTASNY